MTSSMLSPEALVDLMAYDPSSGLLFWKARPAEWFTASSRTPAENAVLWNAKYAGTEALAHIPRSGYKTGAILNRNYRAHRVIWAMVHGHWPLSEIDHINGIRTDNRICNLRDVSKQENGRNQKLHRTNSSGVSGVSRTARGNGWRARIPVDGVMRQICTGVSFEEAVAARRQAERSLGYHENHGCRR